MMLTFLALIMLIVMVMRMLLVLPCPMRIIMITLAIIGLRCHGMVIGMSIGFVMAMGMQHDDHYGDEDAGGANVDAAAIYIYIYTHKCRIWQPQQHHYNNDTTIQAL